MISILERVFQKNGERQPPTSRGTAPAIRRDFVQRLNGCTGASELIRNCKEAGTEGSFATFLTGTGEINRKSEEQSESVEERVLHKRTGLQ
jgi:hypothetical protein